MKRSSRDRTGGAAKELKGRAKRAAGKMTRSRRLQTEGRVDIARGRAQKTAGKIEKALEEDLEDPGF